jgi:acetyl/propionyl-CoA carboxylase alpha subunit
MIRRVLIANRGEIARRIIATCRRMEIATVAVFSEADATALHVREADQAVAIGAAPASDSYLSIDRVIGAARESCADAVHPGYGFLSENPLFAEACEAAGLIFIGPPASVMRRMGSKTGARAAAEAAGVPVVPGATTDGQDDGAIARAVRAVGYPALIKASAGGGGRGMRIVRAETEVNDAIDAARRESQRAFGNGALYVERLVERARHVEVQIFADAHGHVVHLFDRDCTLQRRHQKVIEQAPAPNLSPIVRSRIAAAAIAVARSVGYVNAGTAEFLVDGDGDRAQFYFLELNMRLQVEHPVTEAITGLDLVRAQLLVASGERLPFRQEDLVMHGHAIECRVYAEDARTLLPQSGTLVRYRAPNGDGIRVDAGVEEGQTITVHYDPMIAKLIAHGETAEIARSRLLTAIGQYEILGIHHNLAFLKALLERPEVGAHQVHTRFIEENLAALTAAPPAPLERAAVAMAVHASAIANAPVMASTAGDGSVKRDPWDAIGAWSW